MGNFLNHLWAELQRSLLDTFRLLGPRRGETILVLADLLSQLIVSLLLGLIFFAGYFLLKSLLRAIFARVSAPREIITPVFTALRYGVLVLALLTIMAQLGADPVFITNASRAAAMAFAFYLVLVIGLRFATRFLTRRKVDSSLLQLLRNVVSVVIVSFAFISILAQFGVEVVPLLTTLGLAGIAVGLAAQPTLANFIAGITLLVERPFHIGDWVEISGKTGKVIEINLRTTHLVTRDNIHTRIPNDAVASSDIVNFSAGGPLRLRVNLGIAYKESVAVARELLLPVAAAHPSVLRDRPPHLIVTELGDSSVNLEIRCWIGTADIDLRTRIRAAILESCKETLDAAGVQIPFPHLQLFIEEAKGLAPYLRRDDDASARDSARDEAQKRG